MMANPTVAAWSRRKKDTLPRGLFTHPGGGYGIRFSCGQGHRHEEQAGSAKTQARNTLDDRRARVRREPDWCPRAERGEHRAQQRQDATAGVTIREYADQWLRTRVALSCRERTREIYAGVLRRDVLPTLGDVPLAALTRKRVLEFLASRAPGRAYYGLKTILAPLRALLNAALDDGVIPANPALRVGRLLRGLAAKDARRVTALTGRELAILLTRAEA